MQLGLILLLSTIVAISILTQQAEAAQSYKGKAIGIIIEKSCLISSKCLNYKDIVNLDNSNPVYAGKFTEKKGDLVRNCTSKQNNHQWLQFEKNFTIMVDPCLKFQNQIQTISIVTKLDEYHILGQEKVVEAKSTPDAKATMKVRTYSKDRYVDSTCTHSIITAKNWKVILPDTVNYLRSGCNPNYTKISTIVLDVKQLATHDISTSYKWKLQEQYDYIKKNCLHKRNACTEIPLATRAGLK